MLIHLKFKLFQVSNLLISFEDKPIHFRNGVSGKGKNMISKHDANLSAKKNAKRVIEQVGKYSYASKILHELLFSLFFCAVSFYRKEPFWKSWPLLRTTEILFF